MIGAKKLTWNTCCQTSSVVSIEESRLPPSALGEIAALLTSACNSPSVSRRLISSMACPVFSGSARSTWMWSSGPISHGQFSGNGCREQVMTRQPAAEKRFTVAWPMPRLAPVSRSVRRGWLVCGAVVMMHSNLRIEPRLAPGRADAVAAELDTLVRPERAVFPELDAHWNNSKARPVRRPRHGADRVLGGVVRDRLLEGEPAFQRRGLLARPRADLGEPRAACEIGIGLGVADPLDRAAQPHLPPQRLPVKQERGLGRGCELLALLALHVGVEDRALRVEAL